MDDNPAGRPQTRGQAAAPPKAPKRPRKRALPNQDTLRSVRPRPLHINDKVGVYWDDEAGLEQMDGGAFARYLRTCQENGSSSPQARIAVVGHRFKALPEDVSPEAWPAARAHPFQRQPSRKAARVGRPIATPAYRVLSKEERIPAPGADSDDAGVGTDAYFRYMQPTLDELDSKVEYDLDEDDEEWLAHRVKANNSKTRRRAVLSESEFETVVDRFEKDLHQHVLRRPDLWHAAAAAEQQLAVIDAALPLQTVVKALPELAEEAVQEVYRYWRAKRRAAGKPLLQRLWFEAPWHQKAADDGSDGDDQPSAPFMGHDDAKMPPRGRQMDPEEAELKLHAIRRDLEALRTLADRVRRREKVKKRGAQLWQATWHARAADPVTAAARLPAEVEAAGTSVAVRAATRSGRPRQQLSAAAAAAAHAHPLQQAGHAPGGRHEDSCFWCEREGSALACSTCDRIFCFRCYKKRPGYGINNWSRALKQPGYTCPICRGLESAASRGDAVPGVTTATATPADAPPPPAALSRGADGSSRGRGRPPMSGGRGRGRRPGPGRGHKGPMHQQQPGIPASAAFVAAARAWQPRHSPYERDAGAIAAEQVRLAARKAAAARQGLGFSDAVITHTGRLAPRRPSPTVRQPSASSSWSGRAQQSSSSGSGSDADDPLPPRAAAGRAGRGGRGGSLAGRGRGRGRGGISSQRLRSPSVAVRDFSSADSGSDDGADQQPSSSSSPVASDSPDPQAQGRAARRGDTSTAAAAHAAPASKQPPTRSRAPALVPGLGRNGKPKVLPLHLHPQSRQQPPKLPQNGKLSRRPSGPPPQHPLQHHQPKPLQAFLQHSGSAGGTAGPAGSETSGSSRSDATTDGRQLRNGKLRVAKEAAEEPVSKAQPSNGEVHSRRVGRAAGGAVAASAAAHRPGKALAQLNGVPPRPRVAAPGAKSNGLAKRAGAGPLVKRRKASAKLPVYELPRTRQH